MARVGGRDPAMSWVAGILCAAVVGGLLWLALPMAPALAGLADDVMRAAFP